MRILASELNIHSGVSGDIGTKIDLFMDLHEIDHLEIVFQDGIYRLESDIVINQSVTLTAENVGKAIFKGLDDGQQLRIGNSGWEGSYISELNISGFLFDGIGIHLSGHIGEGSVTNNIFVNPTIQAGRTDQVYVANGEFEISDNTFLGARAASEDEFYLRAIGTYGTDNTVISRNLIGTEPFVSNQSEKVETIKKILEQFYEESIYLDSSFYTTGIGGSRDSNLLVDQNTIHSNTHSDYFRDHNIYFHNFDGLQISRNCVSGWPDDASGGVKVRNGSDLVITDNILNDVPLLTYSYEISSPNDATSLNNTLIMGNVITSSHFPILYWENGLETSIDAFFVVGNDLSHEQNGNEIEFMPRIDGFLDRAETGNIAFVQNVNSSGLVVEPNLRDGVSPENIEISFHRVHSTFMGDTRFEDRIDTQTQYFVDDVEFFVREYSGFTF